MIPWSEALDSAISGALERGEQVILLLNRRGFATFVQCPACGNVPGCPQCAIALTVHQTPPALRCHYCGHEESVPEICGICGHATQRLRRRGVTSTTKETTGGRCRSRRPTSVPPTRIQIRNVVTVSLPTILCSFRLIFPVAVCHLLKGR